jgi:hypothetical protein
MDFTAAWDWPQWTIVIWLALRFAMQTAKHGQEMLEETGENKGKPRRYSGFGVLFTTVSLLFVLIAGGFFA